VRASPARRLVLTASLLGAACGALFYLSCLSSSGLEPQQGCTDGGPAFSFVNLPAQLLAAVYPTEALKPQRYGLGSFRGAYAHWSPAGFVALGLGFYTFVGLVLGGAIAAAWERRRPA
jgi:hypothetical protein